MHSANNIYTVWCTHAVMVYSCTAYGTVTIGSIICWNHARTPYERTFVSVITHRTANKDNTVQGPMVIRYIYSVGRWRHYATKCPVYEDGRKCSRTGLMSAPSRLQYRRDDETMRWTLNGEQFMHELRHRRTDIYAFPFRAKRTWTIKQSTSR